MAKEVANINETENIIELDLTPIKKRKIRINGDESKILELNLSDLSILSRLQTAYPKFEDYIKQISQDKTDTDTDEGVEQLAKNLDDIDKKMRELMDFIFDSNVSELCAPSGSMYDPVNGMFRYEHIIDALSKLYENNMNAEFKKMQARVKSKTQKYTGKK